MSTCSQAAFTCNKHLEMLHILTIVVGESIYACIRNLKLSKFMVYNKGM